MQNIEIPNEDIPPDQVIGKLVLVGISFYTSTGTFVEQYQTNGIAEKVSGDLLYLRRSNGASFAVPYDPNHIKRAVPGIYREKTTGAEIVNPDFLSQWRIDTIDDLEYIERLKEVGFAGWGKEE